MKLLNRRTLIVTLFVTLWAGSSWADPKADGDANALVRRLTDYLRLCVTDAMMQIDLGHRVPRTCEAEVGVAVPTEIASVQYLSLPDSSGITALALLKDGRRFLLHDSDLASLGPAAAPSGRECGSSGGYTVCSNGRFGCIWADRGGKLLGCGQSL